MLHELTYTALLCQEFQRCFDHDVLCLHQPAVAHSTNYHPSFYFVSSNLRLLLVADFENDDFEVGKVETFGYCMAIVNKMGSSKLFIAMPYSGNKFRMYVCFSRNPLSGKSQLFRCAKSIQSDRHEMRLFISKLIFAVKKISNCTVESFQVEPQCGLILTTPINAMQPAMFMNLMKSCTNFMIKGFFKLYDRRVLPDKEGLCIRLGVSYVHPEDKT